MKIEEIEKRVDAELLPVFATMTESYEFPADLPAARLAQKESMGKLSRAAESPDVAIEERNLPTSDGTAEFMVRIYTPNPKPVTAIPVIIWAHGGGFVVGHPVEHDNIAINFVRTANCAVVSVDYRLAPENPFPAGLEDCYSALQWASNNAAELGFDGNRIAVGGYSAGGSLAGGLALLARDRKTPVVFQMLLCSSLDDRMTTTSSNEPTDGRMLTREILESAWNNYLPGVDRTNTSPYASPSRTADLSGLPPAYIGVGELDLLRDEGFEYARRLQQAGIGAEYHIFPGAFHGFELFRPDSELGSRALTEYGAVLKRAFTAKS